jgi:hypothetical protein
MPFENRQHYSVAYLAFQLQSGIVANVHPVIGFFGSLLDELWTFHIRIDQDCSVAWFQKVGDVLPLAVRQPAKPLNHKET